MKSKILSFNTLMETMKKQVWVPALIALGFFLSLPVVGMVYLEILQSRSQMGTGTEAEIVQAYTRLIAGIEYPFLAMMTMGSAVLTGVSSFSWLHSRVKTDFYHSLPIRREKIFLNQIILGVAYFVVPYFVNLLLAYVVGIVHGILRGDLIRMSLAGFLYQCLFYLLIYLVEVLAMLLTGKSLAGVLGAFVLMFYGPALSLLLQGLAASFFDTYASGATLAKKILEGISPVVSYFTCQPDEHFVVKGKVWGIGVLAAAALIILCFILYKKRPSEAAGHTMAFFRLGKLIQYMMEVLVILCSGLLFYSVTVRASLAWLLFGVLLGGVLFHGIMEVVYEGDIRRVMAHVWMMGASIVTSLLIVGIFYWDVFGYDDFFPKQDSMQRVSIQVGHNSYGNRYEAYNQEQLSSMEKLAKDPHVYEVLQEVMKNRLEQVRTPRGTVHRRLDGTEAETIRCISVEYGLSGGRTAYRDYYVDYDQCRQQLMSLYDSQDYKKTVYPLVTMTEEELEQIEQVEIVSILGDHTSLFTGNKHARVEFLKTYRAELMQADKKTLTEEMPIGRLDSWDPEDEWLNAAGTDDSLIYPSFTRTLAALKEQKVELPESFRLEDVRSVTVYDHRDISDIDEESDTNVEKKIWDKEQMKELLPALVSVECNNGFIGFEEDINATVELKDDVNVQCLVRKGQMPDLS